MGSTANWLEYLCRNWSIKEFWADREETRSSLCAEHVPRTDQTLQSGSQLAKKLNNSSTGKIYIKKLFTLTKEVYISLTYFHFILTCFLYHFN